MCDLYGESFAKYNDDNYQAYVQLWEDHFQKQASSSSATPPGSSGGTAQMEGLESLSAVLPVVHPAGQRKRKGWKVKCLPSRTALALSEPRTFFLSAGMQRRKPDNISLIRVRRRISH